MVESGDWLTPHFNYEQRWQKPALLLAHRSHLLVVGSTEWAARFWSALSGLGLVLLTWAAASSPIRRSGTAPWSPAPTPGLACRRHHRHVLRVLRDGAPRAA